MIWSVRAMARGHSMGISTNGQPTYGMDIELSILSFLPSSAFGVHICASWMWGLDLREERNAASLSITRQEGGECPGWPPEEGHWEAGVAFREGTPGTGPRKYSVQYGIIFNLPGLAK